MKAGFWFAQGQTEGAIDLMRLAGMKPAAVICEIMNDDGSMARVPQLLEFCEKHKLKIASIAKLIEYRLQRETQVKRVEAFVLFADRFWRFQTYRLRIAFLA